MTQLNISQQSIDFNFEQSNDKVNQYLTTILDQYKVEDFWYILSKKSNDKNFKENIISYLSIFFEINQNEEKTSLYESLRKNTKHPLFLEGLAYFLEQQNSIAPSLLKNCLKSSLYQLVEDSFEIKQYELIKQIMPLLEEKSYYELSTLYKTLFDKKDTQGLSILYAHLSDLKEKSIPILFDYAHKKFYNFELISELITKYKIDINSEMTKENNLFYEDYSHIFGVTYKGKISFIQYLIYMNDPNSFDLIKKLFKHHGQQIDLDTRALIPETEKSKNFKSFSLLNANYVPSKSDRDARLDYYNELILHCKLKPQQFTDILKNVLIHDYITHNIEHPIYTNIFKHDIFNSENFDRYTTLKDILSFDTDMYINNFRNNHKNQINPLRPLLKTFFNNANLNMQYTEHPFVFWANKKKGHDSYTSLYYCKDTFDYLYNYYKEDLTFFNDTQYNSIYAFIKEQMKQAGHKSPVKNFKIKSGFINRLFRIKEEVIVDPINDTTNEQSVSSTFIAREAKFSFNENLLEQVKDKEIKHYIDSIQLNAEQLITLVKVDQINDDSYYINTLLPKFVNKTIENYLNFETIEPEEAKANVLIQLKLLNKKTFELLNKELTNQKEELQRDNRIQGRLINR